MGDPPAFDMYDIRQSCSVPPMCFDFTPINNFMARTDVREILGVGARDWQGCSDIVYNKMDADFVTSFQGDVEYLLDQ